MDLELHAIADPTRRAILSHLRDGEKPAGAIADLFDVTRPAISHHLSVLREAGLVTMRRRAQSRLYSLNDAAVDRLRMQFNAFWDDALPRLKAVVESRSRKGNPEGERNE